MNPSHPRMLTESEIWALHRKYAKSDEHYERVTTHCRVVNDIAQGIAAKLDDDVDVELLEQACLLHDIGAYGLMTSDECFDYRFYQQHAILGRAILIDEGLDLRVAEMVGEHLMMGLTRADVQEFGLKIPAKDYVPATLEGMLLNYADRFHSKDPCFNSIEYLVKKMNEVAPSQQKKFEDAIKRFGVPDLDALSLKYGHPIK